MMGAFAERGGSTGMNKCRWISVLACILLSAPLAWAARGGKPPGIMISAPVNASVGQEILISVSAVNGAQISFVDVATDRGDDVGMSSSPPFSFHYTIPSSTVGILTISATAMDVPGNVSYQAQTIVQIGTPATLVTLTLVPLNTGVGDLQVTPYPPLIYYGDIMHPYLKGTFSDGVERDLSDPVSGTTYQPQNTGIVTITEDGGIQAVGEGSTTVIATNSGQSVTIPVSADFVDPNLGSLTGGTGTNPDIALTYSGPITAGAQTLALTSTTIKLPANVPQVSWAFNNNSGLPQLKVTPGLVTWKLAKASDVNCSVSFTNNVMPTDLSPYAVTSGTVTFGLPVGGGKCIVLLGIAGQSDSEEDKFTITNPAP